MITIKSEREIELMRESGALVARTLDLLETEIKLCLKQIKRPGNECP